MLALFPIFVIYVYKSSLKGSSAVRNVRLSPIYGKKCSSVPFVIYLYSLWNKVDMPKDLAVGILGFCAIRKFFLISVAALFLIWAAVKSILCSISRLRTLISTTCAVISRQHWFSRKNIDWTTDLLAISYSFLRGDEPFVRVRFKNELLDVLCARISQI